MGFKQSDIEKCLLCKNGIGHNDDLRFHRMSLETFQIDPQAVQRAHGMEQVMNGHLALAHIMGPDEDLAKSLGESQSFIICDTCFRHRKMPPALIRSRLNEQTNEADKG